MDETKETQVVAPPAKKESKAKRVVCGLCVASVWIIAIVWLPIYILAGLIMLSAGICLYELCAMLKKGGYELPFVSLAIATLIWFAVKYVTTLMGCDSTGALDALILPLSAVIAAALFFRVMLNAKVMQPMGTAALTVVAFFYIPFMLSFLLDVVGLAGHTQMGSGIFLAFFLVLVTKLCDTGGYFIGSKWGKHKMCPRLSPGKSWEGTAGGYAFSLTAAGIVIGLAWIFGETKTFDMIRHYTSEGDLFSWARTGWLLLTVVVVVTIGILGDLFESLFKRQCGVKDSSALFPAMGGFFDTFDSIIFVPATAVFMLKLGDLLFL